MGEQMTREQIEAWLLLEGWSYTCSYPNSCEYAWRIDASGKMRLVTHNKNRKADYHIGEFTTKRIHKPKGISTEGLRAIYQEIIKHEKD